MDLDVGGGLVIVVRQAKSVMPVLYCMYVDVVY
jgi:hypothetical protein